MSNIFNTTKYNEGFNFTTVKVSDLSSSGINLIDSESLLLIANKYSESYKSHKITIGEISDFIKANVIPESAMNAISASYALSSSFAQNAYVAETAKATDFSINSKTSSYSDFAKQSETSSFSYLSDTASFADDVSQKCKDEIAGNVNLELFDNITASNCRITQNLYAENAMLTGSLVGTSSFSKKSNIANGIRPIILRNFDAPRGLLSPSQSMYAIDHNLISEGYPYTKRKTPLGHENEYCSVRFSYESVNREQETSIFSLFGKSSESGSLNSYTKYTGSNGDDDPLFRDKYPSNTMIWASYDGTYEGDYPYHEKEAYAWKADRMAGRGTTCVRTTDLFQVPISGDYMIDAHYIGYVSYFDYSESCWNFPNSIAPEDIDHGDTMDTAHRQFTRKVTLIGGIDIAEIPNTYTDGTRSYSKDGITYEFNTDDDKKYLSQEYNENYQPVSLLTNPNDASDNIFKRSDIIYSSMIGDFVGPSPNKIPRFSFGVAGDVHCKIFKVRLEAGKNYHLYLYSRLANDARLPILSRRAMIVNQYSGSMNCCPYAVLTYIDTSTASGVPAWDVDVNISNVINEGDRCTITATLTQDTISRFQELYGSASNEIYNSITWYRSLIDENGMDLSSTYSYANGSEIDGYTVIVNPTAGYTSITFTGSADMINAQSHWYSASILLESKTANTNTANVSVLERTESSGSNDTGSVGISSYIKWVDNDWNIYSEDSDEYTGSVITYKYSDLLDQNNSPWTFTLKKMAEGKPSVYYQWYQSEFTTGSIQNVTFENTKPNVFATAPGYTRRFAISGNEFYKMGIHGLFPTSDLEYLKKFVPPDGTTISSDESEQLSSNSMQSYSSLITSFEDFENYTASMVFNPIVFGTYYLTAWNGNITDGKIVTYNNNNGGFLVTMEGLKN